MTPGNNILRHTGIRKQTESWFSANGWKLLNFQEEVWINFNKGRSGLINAPTGSGKTYSIFLPFLDHWVQNRDRLQNKLSLIWVTPIRALTQEILQACTRACHQLNISFKIEMRTGDTAYSIKSKQFKNPPDLLITTPESLHVLFSQKGFTTFFSGVDTIVVDEWHELLGSKRGVQTELAVAMIQNLNPKLKIWGISATIGNLKEGMNVLLYSIPENNRTLVVADIVKKIDIITILPDEIESYPWAGHLGLKLAPKVLPVLLQEGSCLVFTNTRAQCEIWYQYLLNLEPELAGIMAMHHGSISKELRNWVEDALYEGKLKVVICTSSLDLGVDFQPVDHIIQIGSPKGIARFTQRAGRSGHAPGKKSTIYFVPTHGLELIEISGIREAMNQNFIEERQPMVNCWDVLIQFLTTLAVSEGFEESSVFSMLKKTYSFHLMDDIDFYDILSLLVHGGQSLQAYDEFKKLVREGNMYKVNNPFIAKKHKLSIGTIVSESMIRIQIKGGKNLGVVEEWFISQISQGECFWFAGQSLELVSFRDMTALVKPSASGKGKIPSYQGGRMPLSSVVSNFMRQKLMECQEDTHSEVELTKIRPILELQKSRSILPGSDEFLIEYFETKEGFHLVMFPFEGRNVHEGMASIIAKRISVLLPVSFTMSMNDYGFELLSDKKIDVRTLVNKSIFSTQNLISDIYASINSVELARRKFREIAKISGLIFSGYPGKEKKARHLQASSHLIFEVFKEYEPENILFRQTFEEVLRDQLDETRMKNSLERIITQKWLFSFPNHPSPLSFPLIADRLREKISSEKLEDRIQKMTLTYQ